MSVKTLTTPLKRLKKSHPQKKLLFVLMAGSANVFLMLLICFWVVASFHPIGEISNHFSFSTSIILISGYPIAQLVKSFKQEKIHKIIGILSFALISGTFFTFFQLQAWADMGLKLIHPEGKIDFLYGLSVFHLVHLAGLMTAIAIVMYRYIRLKDNPINKLVLFTNKFEQGKLEMVSVCWFYLQVIWAVIYTAYSFY